MFMRGWDCHFQNVCMQQLSIKENNFFSTNCCSKEDVSDDMMG